MFQWIAIVVVAGFALFLAAAGWLPAGRLRRASRLVIPAGAAVASLLVGVALASRHPEPVPQPEDSPRVALEGEYVASTACRACHPEQYGSWHRSYHRTMTQVSTRESVVGDFDDVRLHFGGERYRVFEVDGEYFGEMRQPGAKGMGAPTVTVPLRQTTGSHHMQLYWFPTGKGRSLSLFPAVFLIDEDRWIPRRAGFIRPPGPAPATHALWNRVCLECHATRSRPRIDGPRVDTEVAEMGIACEACHGPGGPHVAANRSPLDRYARRFSEGADERIVDPSDLDHRRASQVCGQCHSVKTLLDSGHIREWQAHGSGFRPGDDLEVSVNLISQESIETRASLQHLLEKEPGLFRSLFWSDGVPRVAGREYSGLRESGCFTRGEMSCLSCHQLHREPGDPRPVEQWADDQLAPGMRGDAACTGCHAELASVERATAHSFHEAGSSGNECQNCHMPFTTYGLLKAIRDHKVASPSLGVELATGRPNACNQCHLDRPLGWTAEHLAARYGHQVPLLSDDERDVAAGARWALQGDAGVRALVAWSMAWEDARAASGTAWMAPYLLELLDDPYDAVRLIARRSILTLPGFETLAFDELAPPVRRAERVAALRSEWAETSRAPAPSGGRGPATLFDAQGALEVDAFRRLLRDRDDRPLELLE